VQIVDPEEKRLEVIVEDTQLSLAIGKKGQNVRLASKLIAWNIDIKSEEEKRREIEAQMAALTAPGTALTELAGVGPKTIEKLEAAGITSIEKLADMTPEQLVEIPGIGEKMVEKIHQSVAAYFEGLETQATAPAEVLVPEEGALEGEASLAGESEEAHAALEMTPEEAVAEGEQEADEESAQASELTEETAAQESADEAPVGAASEEVSEEALESDPEKTEEQEKSQAEKRGEAAES
jgi:transcription termination/antitermination protein NusA